MNLALDILMVILILFISMNFLLVFIKQCNKQKIIALISAVISFTALYLVYISRNYFHNDKLINLLIVYLMIFTFNIAIYCVIKIKLKG